MPTPTNVEVCTFFFEPVYEPGEEEAIKAVAAANAAAAAAAAAKGQRKKRTKRVTLGGANRHCCRVCRNLYTQNANTGYTNLMTHLRVKHPGWEAMMSAQSLEAGAAEAPAPAPALPARTPLPEVLPPAPGATVTPEKRNAGRQRGPIYVHYVDAPVKPGDTRKTKLMRCRYCHKDVQQLSSRLKTHLIKKCIAATPAVKLEAAAATFRRAKRAAAAAASASAEAPEGDAQPLESKKLKLTPDAASPAPLPSRPDALEPRTLRSVEEKLTQALVATRAPWRLLDNAQFREALQLLQPKVAPAWTPNFPFPAARAATEVVERLARQYDGESRHALARVLFVTLVVAATPRAGEVQLLAVDEWRRVFLLAVQPHVGRDASWLPDLLRAASTLPLAGNARVSLCCPTTGDLDVARRQTLQQTTMDGAVSSKPFAVLAACMAQQSNLLLRDLVESCPPASAGAVGGLEEALSRALDVAGALRALPTLRRRVVQLLDVARDADQQELERGLTQGSAASWQSVALALKRATRLDTELRLAAEQDKDETQTLTPEAEAARRRMRLLAEEDAVWGTLRLADELLAPLHYVSALSEMPQTTSGQLLAAWLWVFGSSVRSPLVDGDAFEARFLRRVRCYMEDHAVACMVLDPRVHGAGLSTTGLRRARGAAMRVAANLLPELDEAGFMRSYYDYVKQQGDFGEPGVWNPANTASPLQFWDDYEGDPHHTQLTTVAKVVCSFVPLASPTETHWASRVRRRSTANASAMEPEGEARKTKLAKIRAAAATRSQLSVLAVADKYAALLDVDNALPVASLLRGSPAEELTEDVAWEVIAPRDGGTRELSLRSVLDALEDGLEEDVMDDDDAELRKTCVTIDASWFDVSPAGLAKVQHAMNSFMQSSGTI